MMTQRHLLTLVIAAAVFLLAAIWISDSNDSSGPAGDLVGVPLFGDAQASLSDADDINITSPDGNIELQKVQDRWLVATKASYPADPNLFRAFWRGLAAATREEPKTANEELFPRMELGEAAKQLSVSAGDQTLFQMQIGKFERGANGQPGRTYVFVEGDDRAWLVSGLPEVSTDPMKWINKEVLNISRDRIEDVSVHPATGADFRISRAAASQSDFTLEDLAAGEELVSQSTINGVANAPSYISLEDVRAQGPDRGDPVSTLTYDMFDGLTIRIDLLQPDGDQGGYWISLGASYDAERMENPDSPAVAEDAPPDGAKEAGNLNEAWAGWLFKIADFKAGDLSKSRVDLVKPVEDEDETESED